MTGHTLTALFVDAQHYTGQCECGWMLANAPSLDAIGDAYVVHLRDVETR